jgi:hypothetical protein
MINTYQALFPYATNKQFYDVVLLERDFSLGLQQGFRLARMIALY